jgi:hypothetical protein
MWYIGVKQTCNRQLLLEISGIGSCRALFYITSHHLPGITDENYAKHSKLVNKYEAGIDMMIQEWRKFKFV